MTSNDTSVQILVAQWRRVVRAGNNPEREAELAERIRKARLAAQRRTSTMRLLMPILQGAK